MLKGNITKTFALMGRGFLCALALVCLFSDVRLALAHGKHTNASKETVTASGASDNSRDALREFVLHAKGALGSPGSGRNKALISGRRYCTKYNRKETGSPVPST